MEPDLDDMQVRAEIDQAYADHLYLADKIGVTLPRILYAIGISFSAIGTLVAHAPSIIGWPGLALVLAGVTLIGLSYKLKYKKLKSARIRLSGEKES